VLHRSGLVRPGCRCSQKRLDALHIHKEGSRTSMPTRITSMMARSIIPRCLEIPCSEISRFLKRMAIADRRMITISVTTPCHTGVLIGQPKGVARSSAAAAP